MTYLVLARKYRPERFSEMVGQEHVTRTLANAIATGRVHHAYLFCGVRGLGKTSAARILARGLVCEAGPSPDPCNVCEQCRAVIEGRSVDVREIDGASNNSVDDIRQLREQVHYLPQSARRKIYIIDEVHMLTASAFNALLKTLEEPPPHVTFIFATTDPHKVLGTILSRVSRLDFRRVTPTALTAHLQHILAKEGFCVEVEGLHTIAVCGDGSVRDALTLLDKVIAFAQDPTQIRTDEVQEILGQSDKNAIFELVDAILAHEPARALTVLDGILASTSDIAQFALALLQHLRDLTVAKLSGQVAALIDAGPARLDRLLEQTSNAEPAYLGQLFDRFTRALDRIDRSRAPRLTLEMAIVDLAHAESLMPLGAVVDRLRELARGGGASGGVAGGGGSAGGGFAPSGPPASSPRGTGRPSSSTFAPPSDLGSSPVSSTRVVANPGSNTGAQAVNPGLVDDLWKMVQGVAKGASVVPPRTAPQPPQRATPQPPPNPGPLAPARGEAGPPDSLRPFVQADSRADPRFDESAKTTRLPQPSHAPDGSRASPQAAKVTSGSTSPRNEAGESMAPRTTATRPVESTPAPAGPQARVTQVPAFVPMPAVAPWEPSADYQRWEAFLRSIRDAGNDLLFATLAEIGVARCDPTGVEWVAPKEHFSSDQLNLHQVRTAFTEAVQRTFGAEASLLRRIGLPTLQEAPSFSLVERYRYDEHRARIEREALADPRLCALVEHFSGKVRNVQVLTRPEGQTKVQTSAATTSSESASEAAGGAIAANTAADTSAGVTLKPEHEASELEPNDSSARAAEGALSLHRL